MGVLKCLFVLLVCFLSSSPVTYAQDGQEGFISIDCGAPEGNYVDPRTGIRYISDGGFIDTGESKPISTVNTGSLPQFKPLNNVRSFPEGDRNCYTIRLPQRNFKKYLIRAVFCYGNYDGKNFFPQFDIHFGVDFWTEVKGIGGETCILPEIIHIPLFDIIHVCLINKSTGIPFISTLELRPLADNIYNTLSGSLRILQRRDHGNTVINAPTTIIRYNDDIYDRIWYPFLLEGHTTLNSSKSDLQRSNGFKPPFIVMRTATTPINTSMDLTFRITSVPSSQYYFYFYFTEIQQLQANESRQFYIYLDGKKFHDRLITPSYTSPLTVFSNIPVIGNNTYEFSLKKIQNSTLPPILNAFEMYNVVQIHSQTDDKDATAVLNIKLMYGLTRNWQGDPCAQESYLWDGLNCSYIGSNPYRITSLNLSSTGLVGELATALSNLTKLETLDLSNNKLSGRLPDFLGQMSSLRTLNLKGNNLTGPIPSKLLDGTILLSVDDSLLDNTNTCQHGECKKKKNFTIPAVASVGALSVVFISLALIWMIRRKIQGKHVLSLEKKKIQYTYSEILRITNNFQEVIGRGGFGTVYRGRIDEKEVAVKIYSSTLDKGFKELQSEVNVLSNVYHKNITSLIGYCIDGKHVGIIYEFMANGDLSRLLSDQRLVFSWLQRIQIALDAAEGLEYMHHGCKPPIVHRDVKSSNILLNQKLRAKVADFGMCKTFPNETVTHVSTENIVGTLGYLDPVYHKTWRVTEGSDVYSFGIVLFEIITSKPAVLTDYSEYAINVTQWVSSIMQQGNVKDVVDPRLKDEFDVDSAKEIVRIAMLCASPDLARRPTMQNVVSSLKNCLTMEINRERNSKNRHSRLQTDSDSSRLLV